MESARSQLLASAAYLHSEQTRLHSGVLAAAASAAVAFGALPAKLNPFIQPLMNAIKRERDELLQTRAADALAGLIKLCVGRTPSPVGKIAGNVCALACADRAETPNALVEADAPSECGAKEVLSDMSELSDAAVARRGAEATLRALSSAFGASVFTSAPKLWELMAGSLTAAGAAPQAVVDGLQILKVLGPVAHADVRASVLELLPVAFDKATAAGSSTAVLV